MLNYNHLVSIILFIHFLCSLYSSGVLELYASSFWNLVWSRLNKDRHCLSPCSHSTNAQITKGLENPKNKIFGALS